MKIIKAPTTKEALQKGLESGAVELDDLRRSAARVLWMVRQNSILESN